MKMSVFTGASSDGGHRWRRDRASAVADSRRGPALQPSNRRLKTRKSTSRPQDTARQRKSPMPPSRKILECCIKLALETGKLTEVARGIGRSTQTIRNWCRRSTESPGEYMVTLPVAGGEQPFHLALRMSLEPGYVPSKGKPATKRRRVIVRPPVSGADSRAARKSQAEPAAPSKQITEQTKINSPASRDEPAERLGSAPSGVKVGETAIIGGTLGKRMT